MSYFVLNVDFDGTKRQRTLLRKAMIRRGAQHKHGYDAVEAAQHISKMPGVLRVVVTCIEEHTMGVWRKGRKS